MVKSPLKVIISLLVFISGPILLWGFFSLDNLPFMKDLEEVKKNHLIDGEYYQLEASSNSLRQRIEERERFSSLNYREFIIAEKIWLEKLTQILDQDFLIRDNPLKESTKVFTDLMNILNKSDEDYLKGGKIDILNDNIQDFKLFLKSHKMPSNLSSLIHFEQTWLMLEKQFFKQKVLNLATWKSSLQKIEETTLKASITSEMKEMVLEKLYFLREAGNDLKGLFYLSNSYLEHSSKITLWITYILDTVIYKKENIILSYESSDYVRKMVTIGLFCVVWAMLICGLVRNLGSKERPMMLIEDLSIQPSNSVIQSIPAHYYDDEEMLRKQVNLVLDETIRDLKVNQTTKSKKKITRRPTRVELKYRA